MKFPPWTSVSEAADLLKAGEVVAIPTQTDYGLAGNAYNPEALAKIFAA
jgi:L-threonylcarbamoyladenylate synthase